MLVDFFKKYMGENPDHKVSIEEIEAFLDRDLEGNKLNEVFDDDKILKILEIRALDRIAYQIEEIKDQMVLR